MDHLLLIAVILLIGWFWQDSLKVRELAVHCARDTCQRQGMQLLDATVTLARLRPTRSHRGHMTLARTYRFEYSEDGLSRRIGFIRLRGHSVETIGLANDLS